MINLHDNLPSIINNDNINKTFETILNFFDPFKSKNYKTKVLDVTNLYYWNENTIRLYDVTKTNKINGSAKDKKYNVIIFEPPRNRNFDNVLKEYINIFYNMLYRNGIIIVRINDFKIKGYLRGSYDIKNVCEKNNLYLSDVIVYKNKTNTLKTISTKNVNIIHSSFMIFKRKIDLKL